MSMKGWCIGLALALVAGCGGEDGATGPQGPAGADGVDGVDGIDGEDGAPGADGVDGEDGAPGADGVDGVDGADGAEGPPGPMPLIVPPYMQAEYAAQSAAFWRWAVSMPGGDGHPLYDADGSDCAAGQEGPVWFLGGAFGGEDIDEDGDGVAEGSRGVFARNCTIPADKAIYFPVINVIYSNLGEPMFLDDNELSDLASLFADGIVEASVEIDSQTVGNFYEDYRIHSNPFWFDYADDSPLTPGGTAGTINGVDEGYYVFLNPLEPGEHTIHFAGTLVYTTDVHGFDWRFELDLTYTITIE